MNILLIIFAYICGKIRLRHKCAAINAGEDDMKHKLKTMSKGAIDCIRAWRQTGEDTDIQGSYTGVYHDADARREASADILDPRPVQDADDL